MNCFFHGNHIHFPSVNKTFMSLRNALVPNNQFFFYSHSARRQVLCPSLDKEVKEEIKRIYLISLLILLEMLSKDIALSLCSSAVDIFLGLTLLLFSSNSSNVSSKYNAHHPEIFKIFRNQFGNYCYKNEIFFIKLCRNGTTFLQTLPPGKTKEFSPDKQKTCIFKKSVMSALNTLMYLK